MRKFVTLILNRLSWLILLAFATASLLSLALFMPSAKAIHPSVTDGLIAYYPFDGNLNDLSGNNNHGSAQGDITYTSGMSGQAASFSGSAWMIANNSLLPTGNSARTLCLWAKSFDGRRNGNADHLANWGSALARQAFGLMIFFEDTWWGYGHDHRYYDTDSGVQADTDWHFHCVTYDGVKMQVYIDGVFRSERSMALNTVGNTLFVGVRPDQTFDNTYDGLVDEVRIYNRVLSSYEIQSLYTEYCAASTTDSCFRPIPHGYNFSNASPAWGSFPNPPANNDFTEYDLIRMFGVDATCSEVANGQCLRLKWSAALWHQWMNEQRNNGHCFGMAATSLRFYKQMGPIGERNPSDFQTDAQNVFDLELESIRHHIAYYHILQATAPTRYYISLQHYNPPANVLAQLQNALASDYSDPFLLFMYQFGWDGMWPARFGHAVTPYLLQDEGNGIWRIYVYDNNYPADSDLYVTININTNSWQYDSLGWDGDSLHPTNTIGLVPMSMLDVPPICPWCLGLVSLADHSFPEAQIWTQGNVPVLITNSKGQRMGYDDGFVQEIPAAYETIIAGGLGLEGTPLYTVPLSDTYEVLLNGEILGHSETVRIGQIGPGYFIGVEETAIVPGTNDSLRIAVDGSALSYQAGHAKAASLFMVADETHESHKFNVSSLEIGPGNRITVSTDLPQKRLTLANKDNINSNYGFSMAFVDENGYVFFLHQNIPVNEGDTHHLDFSYLTSTNTVLLLIDHNSNGIIDQSIELENQRPVVYLPITSKN